jgi:hypothetical protein
MVHGVYEVHKMLHVELGIKGPDSMKQIVILRSNLDHWIRDGRLGFNVVKHFLWCNLNRWCHNGRLAAVLLQHDDTVRNRAGSYHGRPLRELKLEPWWMKTCKVSSCTSYEMRSNHFAHLDVVAIGSGRWSRRPFFLEVGRWWPAPPVVFWWRGGHLQSCWPMVKLHMWPAWLKLGCIGAVATVDES